MTAAIAILESSFDSGELLVWGGIAICIGLFVVWAIYGRDEP